MGDPVARQARLFAAAFRVQRQLPELADMIDYLADAADKQWDATTAQIVSARTTTGSAATEQVPTVRPPSVPPTAEGGET